MSSMIGKLTFIATIFPMTTFNLAPCQLIKLGRKKVELQQALSLGDLPSQWSA